MSTKTIKRIIYGLLSICIILPLFGVTHILRQIDSVTSSVIYEEVEEVKEKNNIEDNYAQVDGITNILIVGVDARNLNENARSDTMMIATVDNINKNLKLTSLARDTYVEIPGKPLKEKLTHAYAYGGVGLLAQTIENNFKIEIDNYVVLNFYSFIEIIDLIGGVEVNVKADTLGELNKYARESYEYTDKSEPFVPVRTSGVQTLNSYQALSYVRIRKNDSAFKRDERQREVISSLVNKIRSLSLSEYPDLLNSVLPNIKTDLKTSKMLNLGFTILKMGDLANNIKQLEFPILKYSKGLTTNYSGWVLDYDTDTCLDILHNFIFNNVDYNE